MAQSSLSEKVVHKLVLSNGLTILVRQNHAIPKVSTQLWYQVGSKDEKTNEKGIAHLIEHMIFKGTETLTESDINMITHKLSGYCNAFTSYDYTGYLFDFPSHHWQEALPIMADCMRNCTFKEEFLASEMKAVIQELKMYKDQFVSCAVEELFAALFVDHPYHYPIIGFKQDLWSLKRETLINFYHKHYIPNNAALVVVGDINKDEAFEKATKYFGSISPDWSYKRPMHYIGSDTVRKTVYIYRDIKQPIVLLAWKMPGSREKKNYFFDILSIIIGMGKGSILYRLLVDELQLVTDVEAFNYDLFDSSVFFIYFEPKQTTDIEKIIDLIKHEIESIREKGFKKEHIKRAAKQAQSHYFDLLEDNQKQAYVIGQTYLATGDDQFLFNYIEQDLQKVEQEILTLVHDHMYPMLTYCAQVLALPQTGLSYWQYVQEKSDEEDQKILSKVTRSAPVQEGKYVHSVAVIKPKPFVYPRSTRKTLTNGIITRTCHNPNIPKIEIAISLPVKHYYDPDSLQGLGLFIAHAMIEGTQQYPGCAFTDALENRGMSLEIIPGKIYMSMLAQDLEIGLSLLKEVLMNATFTSDSIEKVRAQLIADINQYWDTPSSFVNQLAKDTIYKNHPYQKKFMGDSESIHRISRTDIVEAYPQYMNAWNAVVAVVGDLNGYDIHALLEKYLGSWPAIKINPLYFPELTTPTMQTINYYLNRDQVVLCFAGLSVARISKFFDPLLLFDQIFTGGVLGSMSSRLFTLREQSGLFYTIGGSLLAHADEQSGMEFIKTIVSLDRLQEAETALQEVIATAHTYIHPHELEQAKAAIENTLVDNFSSNKNMTAVFLHMERYKLPDDYFDRRAQQLYAISSDQILPVVKHILDPHKMVKIRIGRVK